jgi:uncharacterized membrane protein YgaE (UPF0421/DUF939 family)
VRQRLHVLRESALPIVQTAIAAALAWLVATELVGHERPFFAPIAATIALGVAIGQRGRRTVEVIAGVSLGIAVGDLLLALVGGGPAQIGLFVALAMVAALLLGGGPVAVGQAAASAVLVAALPPEGAFDFSRALDALVGGVIALAVQSVLPVDPLARARRAADPLLADLAGTLAEVAHALEARDLTAAEAALVRARTIDEEAAKFAEAVSTGREVARLSPPRRRASAPLDRLSDAATQLDLAVRNTRVLARGGVRAVRHGEHVPAELPAALRDLSAAVAALRRSVLGDADGARAAHDAAVLAAGRATLALERTGNLSVSALVAALRATAVDLLRSLGADREEAETEVRAAARSLDEAARA